MLYVVEGGATVTSQKTMAARDAGTQIHKQIDIYSNRQGVNNTSPGINREGVLITTTTMAMTMTGTVAATTTPTKLIA